MHQKLLPAAYIVTWKKKPNNCDWLITIDRSKWFFFWQTICFVWFNFLTRCVNLFINEWSALRVEELFQLWQNVFWGILSLSYCSLDCIGIHKEWSMGGGNPPCHTLQLVKTSAVMPSLFIFFHITKFGLPIVLLD